MAEELFRPTSWPEPATRQQFGFHLDEDAWLARLRAADARATLDRLGPYELIEQVGRGAQGVVYKARQPTTGREVVIKRLSAGVFATPAMRARFEREIEAAAALEHPNIVTVYGAEFVEGQPLLVMKWIDGVAIDRWACAGPNGRRPIAEILTLFQRVCDAVHHAHQRGVIHRDLKPSNILVDRRNEPHVLDFGLAKPLRGLHADFSVTETGQFLGTPYYAAPEQLRGLPKSVDVLSDEYALGAVLYHLLTGAPPHARHRDVAALVQAVLHGELPAVSSANPQASRDLDLVVAKALSVEREQRYGSVHSLADDLRRWMRGEPVAAHPPSTWYRAARFARRNAALVAAGALVALTLCAATAVSLTLYVRAERSRIRENEQLRVALAEQERANRERETADYVAGFMQSIFRRVGRTSPNTGAAATVLDLLDLAAKELDESTRFPPTTAARLRFDLATAYREIGVDAPSERHFQRALELWQQAHGDDHLDVANAREKLGRLYRTQGKLADAERELESALRIRRKLLPDPDDAYFAMNLNSLAVLKRNQGKIDEAEPVYHEALRIYTKALGPDNLNVGLVLRNLAALHLASNRPVDAEHFARAALGHFHRTQRDDIVEARQSEENVAQALALQGDPGRDALAIFDEAIRAHAVVRANPHHPEIVAANAAFASYLVRGGAPAAAQPYILAAVRADLAERRTEPALRRAVDFAYLAWQTGCVAIAENPLCAALDAAAADPTVRDAAWGQAQLYLARIELAAHHSAAARKRLHEARGLLLSGGEAFAADARTVQEMLEQIEAR
ncbi:MAG: tetratricopeptide repeat protein [Phycisphaerae bacterium]